MEKYYLQPKKARMHFVTFLLIISFIISIFYFPTNNNYTSMILAASDEEVSNFECLMDTEGDYVKPQLESYYINKTDVFELCFKTNMENYTVDNCMVEGVSVLNQSVNGDIITYDVLYNGEENFFSFTACIRNEGGNLFSSSIFGIKVDDGFILDDISFDNAIGRYYTYQLNNDEITEIEYQEKINSLYHEVGESEIKYGEIACQSDIIFYGPTKTVSGYLKWNDDSGVTHPLQYIKVCLYNTIENRVINTTYTSETGAYSFMLPVTRVRSARVDVYAAGKDVEVVTTSGQAYYYSSQTLDLVTNDDVTMNWTVDMSTETGHAFQIAQAAIFGSKYYTSVFSSSATDVKVVYPNTKDNCYYVSNTIYIRNSNMANGDLRSYNSWDVIMHEYGHHVQRMQKNVFSTFVGGSHNFLQPLMEVKDDNGRVYGKDKGSRLAWSESIATIFSGMAQKYYTGFYSKQLNNIKYVGDNEYISYNGAHLNYETSQIKGGEILKYGETCEATIIGVLWDIFDNSSEAHDKLDIYHNDFFSLLKNSEAKTLNEYVNYFLSTRTAVETNELADILEYYKLAPQNITVNGTTFSWTCDNGIYSYNSKFQLKFYDEENVEIYASPILTDTSYTMSGYDLSTLALKGNISARVFGFDVNSPESCFFSAVTNADNLSATSEPEYLQLELVSRSGFLFYNWKVKITNPNPYDVQVTYNSKMCFEGDAKNYTNLVDLVTITIPKESSKTVDVGANGFAGWITFSIDYTYWSTAYRRVTCADGLSGNLTMNTPIHNQIAYN